MPSLEGIHECYEESNEKNYATFTIQCSLDTLEGLVRQFCAELDEPCYFTLEIPTDFKVEEKIRKTDEDPLHSAVFYLDVCSGKKLLEIMDDYGGILLNDGMSCFGFASIKKRNEIYVGLYKIINIFTADPQRCRKMLKEFRIPKEKKIKTVWENFSFLKPGETRSVTIAGKTVCDLREELKARGMYFAERRER